jgi:hypothetical protein
MAEDITALEAALDQLSTKIDELTRRAKVYDSAFRFFKSNYPVEAPLLDFALAMSEALPEVQNAPSSELETLRQDALELFSRVLQEINKLATAEHDSSKH